jgi:hypothetical protein
VLSPQWQLDRVTDADRYLNTDATCSECSHNIRWIHRLRDARSGREIEVGGCCAARMVAGYDVAGAEREARNRASRLRTYLSGKWRVNASGNLIRRVGTATVTIFPSGRHMTASVKARGEKVRFLNRFADTTEKAKLWAFDLLGELTRFS